MNFSRILQSTLKAYLGVLESRLFLKQRQELSAVGTPGLVEDVAYMELDRAFRHIERVRDLGV